jgi:hypothetical protein
MCDHLSVVITVLFGFHERNITPQAQVASHVRKCCLELKGSSLTNAFQNL